MGKPFKNPEHSTQKKRRIKIKMNFSFSEFDNYLFQSGTHYELYKKMGAHISREDGCDGTHFVLWAPNAQKVCILSDGNGWSAWKDNMIRSESGMWELFLPGMTEGTKYKYRIKDINGNETDKTDPYAFSFELRPNNASVVRNIDKYVWNDSIFLKSTRGEKFIEKPMAVYELHLGSWKKAKNDTGECRYKTYRELAGEIAEYVKYMGYTHIELMGICEHPFDPSWGYQVTGYFAPTSRYGSPEDFMYFVDIMHQNGISVILDWVPAHFPKDSHSLGRFDGTRLYEPNDKLISEYPEWGTYAFDYGKKEVSNFLISSALFWIEKYHIDALRVDAVAAMLYRDFSRKEWSPNKDGGNLNYESIDFLRHLNSIIKKRTGAFMIAEDSSILPDVTKDADKGGIGFGLKWNMGWMNDTLKYLEKDPVYRKYHHNLMTHTTEYAFEENYMLVLSHDEVVYGKGSMYGKAPGDALAKLGCLKTYYTMMFAHPGKKLLFMGQDFGQIREWDYKSEIDWELIKDGCHRDIMDCVRRLLSLYNEREVLFNDCDKRSFEWIDSGDFNRSIFSFIRRNPWNYNDALYIVCNFNPVMRDDYAVGLPSGGKYRKIFSTYPDNDPNQIYKAEKKLCNGREYRIPFCLKPYESVIFEKIVDKNNLTLQKHDKKR